MTGAMRFIQHQAGASSQLQMPRDSGSTDRELIGDSLN
jgi:hypothetical protein